MQLLTNGCCKIRGRGAWSNIEPRITQGYVRNPNKMANWPFRMLQFSTVASKRSIPPSYTLQAEAQFHVREISSRVCLRSTTNVCYEVCKELGIIITLDQRWVHSLLQNPEKDKGYTPSRNSMPTVDRVPRSYYKRTDVPISSRN